MNDPYGLQRFVDAQNAHGTYDGALRELKAGRKRTHWMWFVFPQIAGLGFSAMSQRYAISGLDEAKAYLAHPVLGARLEECAQALLAGDGRDAEAIFGSIDAQKLQSSLTLFAHAAAGESSYSRLLGRFFVGIEDEATTSRLTERGS